MYQFTQTLKEEQFASEMELAMYDPVSDGIIEMPLIYKKGDNASYQSQETPMGLMETYNVGGKAYFLLTQFEIKKYNEKDSTEVSKTIVESFLFSDDEQYEITSTKVEGDTITEEIKATPNGGDPYTIICTFDKETKTLKTLETNAAKLTVKSFTAEPQQISAPDLTGWTKDDTLEF